MEPSTDTSAGFPEDFVSSIYGSLPDTPETPTDPADPSAAGDPPAEPAATPDSSPTADPAAAASDTPVSPDPAASGDASASDDPDPLASAQSLTYTVNGQSRTYDDIKVVGEHGAIVDLDALPKLQQRLAERDHLYEQNQKAYTDFQQLERLTAWTRPGADGKPEELKGSAALEALRLDNAQKQAAIATAVSVFRDSPLKFVSQDEQGNIVWNQDALRTLMLSSELAERHAMDTARTEFQAIVQAQQASLQESTQATVAPQQLWAAAESAWIPSFPSLTSDDKTYLQAQLPHYIRQATIDEVKAGQFKTGERVIAPEFYTVIQDRAALRESIAKTAVTATSAAKENAAKLAGVMQRQPAKPTQPSRRQPVESDAEKKAARYYNLRETLASGRLPSYSDAE